MRIALNRRSFLTASAAAATLPMLPRMAHAATPFAMQAAWINDRPAGHLGADYPPEIDTLATRAQRVAIGPVLTLDTTTPLDLPAVPC